MPEIIAKNLTTAPRGREDKRSRKRGCGMKAWHWILLALGSLPLLACGGCLMLLAIGSANRTPTDRTDSKDIVGKIALEADLKVQAKRKVKDNFKYPDELEFGSIQVLKSGDNYRVDGLVKGTNGLGNKITQEYRVLFVKDPSTDKWTPATATLNGKAFFINTDLAKKTTAKKHSEPTRDD